MPPCLAAEECPPALGCGLQVWVGGGSELCPGEDCRYSSETCASENKSGPERHLGCKRETGRLPPAPPRGQGL